MVTKDMSIREIIQKHPETISVFNTYGFGCVGCQAAIFENIEQGARVHGINTDTLVDDLNKVISKGDGK